MKGDDNEDIVEQFIAKVLMTSVPVQEWFEQISTVTPFFRGTSPIEHPAIAIAYRRQALPARAVRP
ncbi:MAG: hypothetical protein ABR925_06015 [Acidimicrobiales bacterium]|jgi:hypothetical protein